MADLSQSPSYVAHQSSLSVKNFTSLVRRFELGHCTSLHPPSLPTTLSGLPPTSLPTDPYCCKALPFDHGKVRGEHIEKLQIVWTASMDFRKLSIHIQSQ